MPYIFRPTIISRIVNTGIFLFFGANRYGRAFKEFYDLPDHPGRHCGKGKAHEYGEHLLTPVGIKYNRKDHHGPEAPKNDLFQLFHPLLPALSVRVGEVSRRKL